jgi:hypothetical protein
MSTSRNRISLFLDAGVIIQGGTIQWGAAKAVLILATMRDRYTVVLADAVVKELSQVEERKRQTLPEEEAIAYVTAVSGWLARIHLERLPPPRSEIVARAMPMILPALRHLNDLQAVVAAMEARPDWVISTNRAHWNNDLARRSGLRIATPQDFLLGLQPPA